MLAHTKRVPARYLGFVSTGSDVLAAVAACLQRTLPPHTYTTRAQSLADAPPCVRVTGLSLQDVAALRQGNFVGWRCPKSHVLWLSHAPRWWLFRNGCAPFGWDDVYYSATSLNVYAPRVSLWDSLQEAVPSARRNASGVWYKDIPLRPDDALLFLPALSRRYPDKAYTLWPLGAPESFGTLPSYVSHGLEAARVFDDAPLPGCLAGHIAESPTWAPARIAAYAAASRAIALRWHDAKTATLSWPGLPPSGPLPSDLVLHTVKVCGIFSRGLVVCESKTPLSLEHAL